MGTPEKPKQPMPLPLSTESQDVMRFALKKSESYRRSSIMPKDILLGILRAPSFRKYLSERGIDENSVNNTVTYNFQGGEDGESVFRGMTVSSRSKVALIFAEAEADSSGHHEITSFDLFNGLLREGISHSLAVRVVLLHQLPNHIEESKPPTASPHDEALFQ